MRIRNCLAIFLFAFLLLSPVISFTIRTAFASDTIDSTGVSTPIALPANEPSALVYRMAIEGAIGTVTDDRVAEAIQEAEEGGAELLLITMDTPGGFSEQTRSICRRILNSYVPVAVYVAPPGARAGSAGVYITYAAHFAAMAPSTNIGAAHPVGGSGEKIDSLMNEKVTNDAVAQIRAAAEKRGRNVEWAEQAVRQSVSITDNEALRINVIDMRAENVNDLIKQIDGRETETPYGKKTMSLQKYHVVEIKTSFTKRVLQVISDPNIAFILMSIGGLGIILELYNPGSILPGVTGAISLILAFYAFQTLPINYAGLALILLAAVLFIAEIKVVSHGILTIGGLISLFFGGLMLIDTMDPTLQISRTLLIGMVAFIGLIVFLASWLAFKAARNRPFTGGEGMVGKIAEARTADLVYVDGALWKAVCAETLIKGDKVEILSVDSLTLTVKKINS